MHSGNYVLILHTHLPWVLNHGKWPHGTDWLTEAVAECYIPLLNVFNEVLNNGVLPKVTLDISPVLCEQLSHHDFIDIFINYCNEKIILAQKDEREFTEHGYHPHQIYLTKYWQKWYEDRKNDFIYKYNCSIIASLKKLQDCGAIEIMTCGATHGYFPLLGDDRSINLQVKAAVENYKKHFDREPRGIWLPECAYRPAYIWKSLVPIYPYNQPRLRPGIEQILAKNNIKYFVTDENLIKRTSPIGMYLDDSKDKFITVKSEAFKKIPGRFDKSPMTLTNVGSGDDVHYGTASVFTRHHDISMQVWSGNVGYPGEPDYLDFHKKHLNSMLKYWRVTDNKADMMYKTLYYPEWTQKKIDLQSNHFIHNIEKSINWYKQSTSWSATLCTPFDTELFGHWWFEGPEFLKAVIYGLKNSPYVNMVTATEELLRQKPVEVVSLPEGSWGENNNHDVWSNEGTVWTWEAIYNDEFRWQKITDKLLANQNDSEIIRLMTQALRELMLLQASDWQFLITAKSAQDYAEQRFSFHHSDFNTLCDYIEKYADTKNLDDYEWKYLEQTEIRNSCFPELKLEWWSE